jgi:glycosyltransferase involved in cell wall biosynthesis
MAELTISVIIPTYNGAAKLPVILAALEKQSCMPTEVIVVVDGSTDNTLEVLQQNWNLPLKVLVQGNRGRSVVRNKGASEAECDLLIFFDDDMIPDPDCVKMHLLHHLQNSNSILTGAQIDTRKGVTDFQFFKHSLSVKWSAELRKNSGKPLSIKKAFVTAANFSIPKEIFLQLKGFEEQLTDTEDFELAVRAAKSGIKIYYDYTAFAWHNDKITCASYIKRLRQYRKSNEKLARLKPTLVSDGLLKIPRSPSGIKKIFFIFFCSSFWINQIDRPSWILWLPKAIRYRIYSYVVTANGVYFPDKIT